MLNEPINTQTSEVRLFDIYIYIYIYKSVCESKFIICNDLVFSPLNLLPAIKKIDNHEHLIATRERTKEIRVFLINISLLY